MKEIELKKITELKELKEDYNQEFIKLHKLINKPDDIDHNLLNPEIIDLQNKIKLKYNIIREKIISGEIKNIDPFVQYLIKLFKNLREKYYETFNKTFLSKFYYLIK